MLLANIQFAAHKHDCLIIIYPPKTPLWAAHLVVTDFMDLLESFDLPCAHSMPVHWIFNQQLPLSFQSFSQLPF